MSTSATSDLGVPVRTPYVKTATGVSGGEMVTPAAGATTAAAPAANLQTAATGSTAEAPAQPEAPAKPLTILESFHPQLDPAKVTMTFDDKTGRVRVVPLTELQAEAEAEATTEEGLPALATPHQDIPGGSAATAAAAEPGGTEAALRGEISQLTQLVTLMAQSQMTGKPLGELLGLQAAAPAQPAQPDFSDVDLYQPQNLAAFIQQTVQGAIQGAMAPHQQTMEGARRRQEYDGVAAQFGADPHFNTKVVQALTLVKDNPGLTISQGYEIVNRIASQFIPAAAATAPAPTPAPAAVKPATRTITPAQAEQKAAQAKQLPGNSGVRGAGAPPMPEHIKGLGQMIAWNLQQAHTLGN